ncbi:hypothetical protein BV898_05357 [Hypsibius exemplaris]|uniref:F-box domain-containing protein n=1 Tax=Hypsibius exemplaris TaxID=2072580 RepID=A0A1W0WZZ2_HYPEX|nr:hypothetical protein BV898_05357 [Hypsibius exemplaris]
MFEGRPAHRSMPVMVDFKIYDDGNRWILNEMSDEVLVLVFHHIHFTKQRILFRTCKRWRWLLQCPQTLRSVLLLLVSAPCIPGPGAYEPSFFWKERNFLRKVLQSIKAHVQRLGVQRWETV